MYRRQFILPRCGRLNQIENLQLTLLTVENHFWRRSYRSRLINIHDLNRVLPQVKGTLYLPAVMLNASRELFLDGRTAAELAAAAKTEVRFVEDITEFLSLLMGNEMR